MGKKIFILFTFIASFITVQAQVEQGAILVAGTVGVNFTNYTFTTSNELKNTTVNINPGAGYFISDEVAIGLGVGYSSFKSDHMDYPLTGDYQKSYQLLFSIGPFARYYFIHGDIFHIYGELGMSYGAGKIEDESKSGGNIIEGESKISNLGIGINPGVDIRITNKMSIEMTYGFVGYSSQKEVTEFTGGDTEFKIRSIGINWGAFTFGVVFFL